MLTSPAPRRALRVVGALARLEGRILLTRRIPGRSHGGCWEFPGGKVRSGESDAAALARELLEELGVEASVGAVFLEIDHAYPDFDIHLVILEVCLPETPLRCLEVDAIAWVLPEELLRYPLTPADVPAAHKLLALAGHAHAVQPLSQGS